MCLETHGKHSEVQSTDVVTDTVGHVRHLLRFGAQV